MSHSETSKELQAFLESIGAHVRVLRIESLGDLDSLSSAALSKGEQLKGLTLLGHGNTNTFLFNEKESYTGKELGDVLADHLSTVPISQNFGVYLGSCLGACESKSSDNIQIDLGNTLWERLKKSHKTLEQLDVIAHKNTVGAGRISQTPGLRWFIRTRIPEKLNTAMVRVGKSAYGIMALEITPAVIGILAPLLSKVGLPNELAIAAFVGGLYVSVGLMLVTRAADTEVVLRSVNRSQKSQANRLILADAFKLAERKSQLSNCSKQLLR